MGDIVARFSSMRPRNAPRRKLCCSPSRDSGSRGASASAGHGAEPSALVAGGGARNLFGGVFPGTSSAGATSGTERRLKFGRNRPLPGGGLMGIRGHNDGSPSASPGRTGRQPSTLSPSLLLWAIARPSPSTPSDAPKFLLFLLIDLYAASRTSLVIRIAAPGRAWCADSSSSRKRTSEMSSSPQRAVPSIKDRRSRSMV
mmetsp:Transcript_90913/g.261956  ORF Transcript_90913/g.261956 Transcript_90913/m.261956 type:complete len:200 (+) Transcript_90913:90-689(+)